MFERIFYLSGENSIIHSMPYLSLNIPAYKPHGLSPIGPSTSPPLERPVNNLSAEINPRVYCCHVLYDINLFAGFSNCFEVKFFHWHEYCSYRLSFFRVSHQLIQNSWSYLPCDAKFICAPSTLLCFRNC